MFRMIDGIPVWGEPLENAVKQIRCCARGAYRTALMADHHQGYSMPIGGVAAYENRVSPSGVGYDISCGNKAVCLGDPPRGFEVGLAMDRVFAELSFGIGRKNKAHVDHPLFHDDPGWSVPIASSLRDLAREQFGTIGSGNHYVDLMLDEDGRLWCAVHFGSRGFGYKIASHFIKAGGGRDGIDVDPVVLDVESDLGEQYILCMKLAGRYTYAARDWVCGLVARIIGAEIVEQVHVHHNFAWEETHDGKRLWVVRKGATPLAPGTRAYIGGSMGDDAYVVEGVDSEEGRLGLYSAPHGAGRSMSRTQAAGKPGRRGRPRQGGIITREMMLSWLKERRIELRGAGVDESPHCYKRLDEVMKHHSSTVKIVHVLRPIGVAMAGEGEFDPWRD